MLKRQNGMSMAERRPGKRPGIRKGSLQNVEGRAEVEGDHRFPPQEIDSAAIKHAERMRVELPGDQD